MWIVDSHTLHISLLEEQDVLVSVLGDVERTVFGSRCR